MRMEFRPFVMYVNQPNFRSEPVNTNSLGFREEYWLNSALDWEATKEHSTSCDLLVGSSTAFGVDASSDRGTITHFLNTSRTERPVINLGVRGAMPQQELLTYWIARRHLPPPKNIVILSGVNLASFSAMPDTLFYKDFGGVFVEQYCFSLLSEQYKKFYYSPMELSRSRLIDYICARVDKSSWMRRLMMAAFPPEARFRPERPSWKFNEKCGHLIGLLENDLDLWRLIQADGVKVHFVLQPAVGWTKKPLADAEQAIMREDRKLDPTLDIYANSEFYQFYMPRIRDLCERRGIAFYDANAWLDEEHHARQNYFTDVCHMNDAGYAAMAQLLASNLCWQRGEQG